LLPNEEDEVLLAISEQLPKFKMFLDSNNMIHVLPLLQFLLCVEETVVREQAVEGSRELFKMFSDEQIQKDVINLITNIFNQEYFTGKVSVCFLIRMCYERAGKEKEKLRNMYYKLCEDETPLIKRSAAKEFGPLCLVMEKEVVNPDMINYFKKFMTDSDSVKVIALSSLIQLVKLFHNTDQQRLNVQVVVAASEDKSWRVRHELAKIFPLLIEGFGNQINELVPTLGNLIKDSETEVRLAALEGIIQAIKSISSEKVNICIIPALLSLSNESSVHVKACIGECLGSIARSVGYSSFNSKLSGILDGLLKDDNAEVRLGVTKSLYDIFISSEGSLLNSIGTILGGLQKDNQYRIRETSFEIMARLGCTYVNHIYLIIIFRV
jgi:serine/threonine-protein phosphatase 2A regulatory subunit A